VIFRLSVNAMMSCIFWMLVSLLGLAALKYADWDGVQITIRQQGLIDIAIVAGCASVMLFIVSIIILAISESRVPREK
jgi:hypothetical protein